jgi:jumonji domain-containing protein 7
MDTAALEPPYNNDADPIVELLTSYTELNSSDIDELDEPPSALEFMRYVARNRPFVVRGGASDWRATKTWNVSLLKDILKGQSVNVAVTPEGYAIYQSSPFLFAQIVTHSS